MAPESPSVRNLMNEIPECGIPETGCHVKHVVGPGIEGDGSNEPLQQIPVTIIGFDHHLYCGRR